MSKAKKTPKKQVQENELTFKDYYLTDEGLWVFTEHYHRKRGYCCQSGCRHCPFGFKKDDGRKTN